MYQKSISVKTSYIMYDAKKMFIKEVWFITDFYIIVWKF